MDLLVDLLVDFSLWVGFEWQFTILGGLRWWCYGWGLNANFLISWVV
jgi:hypothetical protein